MSKRNVLKIYFVLFAVNSWVEITIANDCVRFVESFNGGWKFVSEDIHYSYFQKSDDSNWQDVTLPHIPRIESLVQKDQWQGVCWYRKTFTVPKEYEGKKVFLQFEGVMITASVWVNGITVGSHEGGYLPFTVDISDAIIFDRNNTIAIRVNNNDSSVIPPAKQVSMLDFYYYGGLYRNVHMLVTDKLHITDAVRANKISSGGVFVTTPYVSPEMSLVKIKTHVLNESEHQHLCKIRTTILDSNNNPVGQNISYAQTIKNGQDASFEQMLEVKSPALWSLQSPDLYYAKCEVIKVKDNTVVDAITTQFGIRSIKFSVENGFQINGKTVDLRGVNRHEQYPYIGNALSRNAQFRDAKKIKDAGFDYVRLSHYPHSPDFMDACDELGLVVMDCIPGWQLMGSLRFKELCYQNCRDLIRRDRNHPSVILWEVSLNETGMDKDYIAVSNKIAHEEYPGDQCFTCGWFGDDYDVLIQARQHRLKRGGAVKSQKPYLVSEYGDWEFYAIEERGKEMRFKPLEVTSRQFRADGERRMLCQAMNFQEAFDDNRANTPCVGDGLWVMYDYNRGKFDDLESSGIMDIFRLPKFSCYFYRSQRSADEYLDFADTGPMVYIASYWDENSPTNVTVYSNCEEVALYLNKKLMKKRQPDQTEHTSHLPHPPFTFTLNEFIPGTLKAVGYINGVEAANHIVQTPEQPVSLNIEADICGKNLAADGVDAIFIHAKVVDKNGTIVPDVDKEVLFSVEGPAKVVGQNPICAEAGIATVLLQAGCEPGKITIQAMTEELQGANYTLISK